MVDGLLVEHWDVVEDEASQGRIQERSAGRGRRSLSHIGTRCPQDFFHDFIQRDPSLLARLPPPQSSLALRLSPVRLLLMRPRPSIIERRDIARA